MARRKHKETEKTLNFVIELLFLPIALLVALFTPPKKR
jgi:hypothetical protein